VLKEVFGLSELRPGQRAVIDAVMAGKHTLAIMPTGAGKSLCYQVPAMLKPGMTMVVSPLIALMRDQSEKMSALDIPCVQINSAVSSEEIRHARTRIGRRTVEFSSQRPNSWRPSGSARCSAVLPSISWSSMRRTALANGATTSAPRTWRR
jgi:superfamily II DNA helicase RecQ